MGAGPGSDTRPGYPYATHCDESKGKEPAVIEITLSSAEWGIAKFIGKLRNKKSLASKINGRRDPAQEDEEMNMEAAGAELAVAKMLNVYPDLSPTSGELPKWDLRGHGARFEVKRNHLATGDLLVPKLNSELVYILVCGELPKYNVVGYLPGTSIPLVGEWAELTYGACWRVHPGKLKPIESLF